MEHKTHALGKNEAMVTVFTSANFEGELEAMGIKSVLDGNSIPCIFSGPHVLPNLAFQIQVPAHLLGEAEALIRAARQDGRKAAARGEAEAAAAAAR